MPPVLRFKPHILDLILLIQADSTKQDKVNVATNVRIDKLDVRIVENKHLIDKLQVNVDGLQLIADCCSNHITQVDESIEFKRNYFPFKEAEAK